MPPDPPPPTAPVPVSATFSIGPSQVVVNFDQALVPGALNAANWQAEANIGAGNRKFDPVGAPQAVASRVQFIAADVGVGFLVNNVRYQPPPFDVVGLVSGMPAAAFPVFPLTVIP